MEVFHELFDKLIKEQKLDPLEMLNKLKKYDKSTSSISQIQQPTIHNASASDNKKYTHDALLDEQILNDSHEESAGDITPVTHNQVSRNAYDKYAQDIRPKT